MASPDRPEIHLSSFASARLGGFLNDCHALQYPLEHPVVFWRSPTPFTESEGLPTGWIPSAEAIFIDPSSSPSDKAAELFFHFGPVGRTITLQTERPTLALFRTVDKWLSGPDAANSIAPDHMAEVKAGVLPPESVLRGMFIAIAEKRRSVPVLTKYIKQLDSQRAPEITAELRGRVFVGRQALGIASN